MLENSLCVEIKEAEKTISLTEEKCMLITQRIPEMMELERTEKDRVTRTLCIYLAFTSREKFTLLKCFITDFPVESSN